MGVRRATVTERQPERWLSLVEAGDHGILEDAALDPAQQADEALLMGLRLAEGLDLDRLAALSGFRPAERAIDALAAHGLVERRAHGRLVATREGRIVLNEVVLRLSSALQPMRASPSQATPARRNTVS
jgi:oxygen-independent coproporphyrinogen-3 oxidase